jgi:hypothetical protein
MTDKPKKKPVNTPASGMPASGIPAGGMGWGGAPSGKPARAWVAGEKPVLTGKAKTLRDHLAPYIEDAIAQMVKIMGDGNHPQQRAAADSLLDRYFGKASQHLTTEDVTPQALDVSHLSPAELDELQVALATVRRLTAKPVTIDAD